MPKRRFKPIIIISLSILLIVASITAYKLINRPPAVVYSDADFSMVYQPSRHDMNQNGIDDFTDILHGAQQAIAAKPKYKSAYYAGGYPPAGEAVCTDIIWMALQTAGYDLKTLVDSDISANPSLYPRTEGIPDPNIDFRRVPNLLIYLQRHTLSLTNDPTDISQWQAGDIVVFGDSHIAIVSDKRNAKGIPYIISTTAALDYESDTLIKWNKKSPITGHFRWDMI